MIPVAFEYQKAGTIEDALTALAGGDAKLVAGGYSLIPAMKLRLTQPKTLIDIAGIPSLKGIREENGQIIINAATTHAEIAANDLIKKHLPFFGQAANIIGDVQVRNRGTIGGSLAHADPAADWPALVLAADAVIEVIGVNGIRSIEAVEYFTGLFTTQLQENEIITSVRVPLPPPGATSVYLHFRQPASRFAIVGCAVIRLSDGKVNIAFTGVADTPFRDRAAEQALSGKSLDAANIAAALNASISGVSILSDHFASEDYRKHLARVFLKRALEAVA